MGWSIGPLCRQARVVRGFLGLLGGFSLWGGLLVHCVGWLGWSGGFGGSLGFFFIG